MSSIKKTKNPMAAELRKLGHQTVKPKKGKGSYKRNNKIREPDRNG